MVRVPRSFIRAGFAGITVPARTGAAVRRIPVAPDHRYWRPVTVDLGNDGMAPQVTFTAGGTAQAVVGPGSAGDLWSLDQCFLSTSVGQLDAAQCTVFAGPLPLSQYAVTGSLAGGGSQFGMGGVAVPFGWFAWALWSGGTPGALAFLRLTGVKTVLTD
jgi:hypothetical protein